MKFRNGWILMIAAVALSLLPGVCWGWATLSDLLPMTPDEQATLQKLLDNFGTNKVRSKADIVPRRGPHPTHQFVMRQAYLLLEKDPAFAESPWKLPTLNEVLCWDGIVRETGAGGVRAGMWERSTVGTGTAAPLAPARGAVSGPSADAEVTANGAWNATYNAAFHYWNPWLRCGESPQATANCYADLVKEMTTQGKANAKARLVSHMGHYMSDTICAKHADMIALNRATLAQLTVCANTWFTEHANNNTIALDPWLRSQQVTNAVNLIIAASGVAKDSAYWKRVNSRIVRNPLLNTNTAWVKESVDIAEPSLRNSVAAYLAYLHDRPTDKDISRFYNFYDPFYFNGQIVITWEEVGDRVISHPQFALCTPASEHLQWETNPALADYVNGSLDKRTLGEDPAKVYLALPERADMCSPDDKKRATAYRESVREYVQNASLTSHGSSPDSNNDFGGFRASLDLSIRHVFSILRSTITAIRCEPTYAYFPEEKLYRIYCDVSNVADEALDVRGVRISVNKGGKLQSCPQWAFTVSKSVAKGGMDRVIVELPESRIPKKPEFFADIFGRYKTTPDLGFWRGEVDHRPARIMHGMSMPAFDRVKGALDLVICFDTTGSMGSSIDSVRKNAITVLGKLKKRIKDLRVALISFKDISADGGAAFTKTGFSSNVSRVISKMKGWKASGGGDEAEDQLQAIHLALDLWGKGKSDPRKPTKIVVVITDASAKDPDSRRNTQASIAKYAEEVDPAHIYPIVVGSATLAHQQAASLAKLTGGEVLTAKSGDEVAAALATAVDKAIAAHGDVAGPSVPPWVLFYGGLMAVAVGAVSFRRDLRKRARGSAGLR